MFDRISWPQQSLHGLQELAESRRKAAEARKASEEAAARTEQAFCEASPWLNEDRSGNVSCADPGRQVHYCSGGAERHLKAWLCLLNIISFETC